MEMLENVFAQQIVEKLGWTLLHFVWQGAIVALALAALLRILRKSSPNLRYLAACGALVMIVLLPVITMQMVPVSVSRRAVDIEPEPLITPTVSAAAETKEIPASEISPLKGATPAPTAPAPSIPWEERLSGMLEPALPYIVLCWLLGVLSLSAWHLGGWVQLQRLRRKMIKPIDMSLENKVGKLAQLLGVHRAIRVMNSALVQVPTIVGWLRPVILLPAGTLTGLSTEQLEAILAHELAHIRRHDYLVNILQALVEILGFYHPAVWWVSHRIRVERENCCDDVAVSVAGDKVRYAKALTMLEESRTRVPELVVAASGSGLFSRIKRLLSAQSEPVRCSTIVPLIAAATIIILIAIPATLALTSRSDKNNTDLETPVVEGIRANRNKFECGVLSWSRKRVDNRYADSNDPRKEIGGQYKLWWEGRKIATKYEREQLRKGPEGQSWVERQQGGNSYDGGVLSRKPDFGLENWLGPYITRWRGKGSQDKLIPGLNNLKHISKAWSAVDANNVKLIRLKTKNMNKTDSDYGGYSIRDYEPSKGYGLVNEEWYNPDGSLRMKHTVRMSEVIPSGWFPVEVDFKSFAITDGSLINHQHYALDIERCSFNDRSALPKGIFKLGMEKQLKYQERLQKYLAMELEGLSDIKEIDKADKVKLGAREAIEKFVAAAIAGELEKAGEYAHPERLPANQIADVTETAKGQSLWIMAVVADDSSAMAVSSVIRGDHERIGPLIFSLDRVTQNGRDNWRIHDIDMERPDGAQAELKKFLEKHPEAQKISSETKPAGQVEGEEDIQQEQEKIQMLFDAAYRAVIPAENLNVEFIYEEVNPLHMYTRQPSESSRFERKYAVTISGVRSRVEWYQEQFKPSDSKEPTFIINTTWVFDGTWQLKLKEIIKSSNPRNKGNLYTDDQNYNIIIDELLGWPFDLRTAVADKRYPCELVDSNKPGIYIVEVGYKDTGARYRFTIDADKGFHITKYKLIRKDGSIAREVNYKIRKRPDGLWYMNECEFIRYPWVGEKGEPKVDHRTKITKAEFNIDIPDETFKLKFPEGTKIWDDTIKDWYDLETPEGVNEVEIVSAKAKPAVQVEGEEGNGENTEDGDETSFEQKYRDPREFVKREHIPYGLTHKLINKEQLPLLHKMLEDEKYAPYWHNIARVIGYISDDPNSVPILLNYFKRDDGSNVSSLAGKMWSIAFIGKIGGEQADDILRQAYTRNGAAALAQNWLDKQQWPKREWKGKKDVINYITNAAIQGLVYSGKKQNIKIVEQLYKEEAAKVKKTKRPTKLCAYLVDAMAARAFIADHNDKCEAFFALTPQKQSKALRPYLRKYTPAPPK